MSTSNNKSTRTDGIFWAKNFATGISDAVLLLDKQYNLIWWNEIATRTLFISKHKHADKPVIDLFNSQTFSDYILEKQIGTVEFSLPKQPDKMLSVVLIPYGKVFILVAQDISKKNHIDKIRQDFIANVSHEMRTPLTVIQGYLEIMQEEISEAFPLYEPFFIQMQQQMQRLENLLQDLLLLSRIQKGKLKAHDLSIIKAPEIIKDLAENTKNISTGKHQFTLNIDDSLFIIGQEQELRSCFENLIINAVRYSPDGGEIQISWTSDSSGIFFSVKDHGIGIKPSDIPRLTERFYRVDKGRSRNTGGTGLGLAIVKHVLIRHGGSIEIASEIDIGSSFTCCFPKSNQRNVSE